jgi:hypothetical protein
MIVKILDASISFKDLSAICNTLAFFVSLYCHLWHKDS